MKKYSNSNGITIVALVLTIIIMLILAGVTVSALTNENGLLKKTKSATDRYKKAEIEEEVNLIVTELSLKYYKSKNSANKSLKEYIYDNINNYETSTGAIIKNNNNELVYIEKNGEETIIEIGSDGKVSVKDDASLRQEEISAETIQEAQANAMLSKTVNSELTDENGNKITIPAGFKILNDSTTDYGSDNKITVEKGIVITDGTNEFVWIPVIESKNITLGRYVFDDEGNIDGKLSQTTPEAQLKLYENTDFYYTEGLSSSTLANAPAENIVQFKNSVEQNNGYYIGRYEARTTELRNLPTDDKGLTKVSENKDEYVYRYVTQGQAVELCQDMYNSTEFTSDLVNSFAWDTATLFLEQYGERGYSRKTAVNTDNYASKGTNNKESYSGIADVQCNIYDMSSNIWEWSTETYSDDTKPCVDRGGGYFNPGVYTSSRDNFTREYSCDYITFRPILYLKTK